MGNLGHLGYRLADQGMACTRGQTGTALVRRGRHDGYDRDSQGVPDCDNEHVIVNGHTNKREGCQKGARGPHRRADHDDAGCLLPDQRSRTTSTLQLPRVHPVGDRVRRSPAALGLAARRTGDASGVPACPPAREVAVAVEPRGGEGAVAAGASSHTLFAPCMGIVVQRSSTYTPIHHKLQLVGIVVLPGSLPKSKCKPHGTQKATEGSHWLPPVRPEVTLNRFDGQCFPTFLDPWEAAVGTKPVTILNACSRGRACDHARCARNSEAIRKLLQASVSEGWP